MYTSPWRLKDGRKIGLDSYFSDRWGYVSSTLHLLRTLRLLRKVKKGHEKASIGSVWGSC
jgi:hypothetical protein